MYLFKYCIGPRTILHILGESQTFTKGEYGTFAFECEESVTESQISVNTLGRLAVLSEDLRTIL